MIATLLPMDTPEHLQIDLADPQDIRAKLPEAKRLYASKKTQLEELRQQVTHWEALVDLLARVVGEEGVPKDHRLDTEGTAPEPAQKPAPAQERAIRALKQAGRPMGPSELYRYMDAQGLNVPSNPNALGATLWTAVKAGRAKKTPEGLYAPLDGGTETAPPSSESEALPGLSRNGEGPSAVTTDPSQSRA